LDGILLDSPDDTSPATPGIQDLLATLVLDCSLTSGLFPGRQLEPDTTELSPDPTVNYPLDLLRAWSLANPYGTLAVGHWSDNRFLGLPVSM